MESFHNRPISSAKSGNGKLGNSDPMDLPSGKYGQVPEPSKVLLRRAAEPAHPVLPKHRLPPNPMAKTMRERLPLASSLTGAGRAGKVGSLQGSSGSKYQGHVLAGRPHGKGQYYAPGVQPGKPLRLVYEGDFVKGAREGHGTCYYNNGEVYTGTWVHNKRTGQGKLTYVDGSVYDGMWQSDRRHGVGTFYSRNGDIFVGSFIDDKRHGLGTTYMPARGRKYVAEYVADSPKCGSFFELSDADVEVPPTQTLRDTIAAGRIAQEIKAGQPASHMPHLQLMQPSKVLAKEFVDVRQQRAKMQLADNTLPAESMSLLRHAFILVAGGDDSAAFVLPHQLQELMVLAGLDPAAPAVVKLLGLLRDKAQQTSSTCCSTSICAVGPDASTADGAGAGVAADGRLRLDDFLGVLCFFREQPLAVLEEQQAKQAAAEAARRAAAAAAEVMEHSAAGLGVGGSDHVKGQQQDEQEQEQWQEDGEGEEACAEQHTEGDEEAWGAATNDGMLEWHIAQHRAQPLPTPAAAAAGEPSAEESQAVEADATAGLFGEPFESAAADPLVSSCVLQEAAAAEPLPEEPAEPAQAVESSSSEQLSDSAPERAEESSAALGEGALPPPATSEPAPGADGSPVADSSPEAQELGEACSSEPSIQQAAVSSSAGATVHLPEAAAEAAGSSCEGEHSAVSGSHFESATRGSAHQAGGPMMAAGAEPAAAAAGEGLETEAGQEAEAVGQEYVGSAAYEVTSEL